MSDPSDVEAYRNGLAKLCRMPAGRVNPPQIDIGNRWSPLRVKHPQTLMTFGFDTAWEFIADYLTEGLEITYRPPNKPENGNAYEMVAPVERGNKGIYMKVALIPGVKKLVGLSFHYERH